jgi:PEP-CTERM motif
VRFRGFRRVFFLFLLLLPFPLLSSTAFAGSVTLSYVKGTGSGIGGGAVYPYEFYINNSTTPTFLMCDSYDNIIRPGETWTATVTPFLQGVGLFGPTTSLDYKAAGLIFKSMLGGGISATVANWAIWGLFSSTAAATSQYKSTGAGAIDSEYLVLAQTAKNSAFSGLLLYTPIAGTQSWGGMPQEFIGFSAVPEPSALVLMGTGLLALTGVVRRKLARI